MVIGQLLIWLPFPLAVFASTVTVEFGPVPPSSTPAPVPSSIRIRPGDTVTWVNKVGTNARFFALHNEFQSVDLSAGQTFSHTFADSAFVAYGVTVPFTRDPVFGTVDIINSDNRVILNSPVQGLIFPDWTILPIAASVEASNDITQVQFFAEGLFLVEARLLPYRIYWTNSSVGTYRLTARAIDKRGEIYNSDPIQVVVSRQNELSVPRLLPGGESVLLYNAPGRPPSGVVAATDVTAPSGCTTVLQAWYGVYVEQTHTNAPHQFFWITRCRF